MLKLRQLADSARHKIMEQNNKNRLILGIVVVFLCVAIFSFFKFGNNLTNRTVNTNNENTIGEQPSQNKSEQQELSSEAMEEIVKKIVYPLGDGSMRFSGKAIEVNLEKNEVIIDLSTNPAKKILKSLKILSDTKIYTIKTDEVTHFGIEEISLSLADVKKDDFLNVAVVAEDGIEKKDIFQTIEICITKIFVRDL